MAKFLPQNLKHQLHYDRVQTTRLIHTCFTVKLQDICNTNQVSGYVALCLSALQTYGPGFMCKKICGPEFMCEKYESAIF